MITLPILDLLLAIVLAVPAHPHNPMAITFAGAQGKATFSYRTLPWNAESVAAGGRFTWFGALNTEMDLTVGDVTIPAGTYSVDVPSSAGGSFAEATFTQGGEAITVPITAFQGEERDHQDLEVYVINKGFVTTGNRSTTPTAGATFVLKMSFGTVHRQLELKEVFKTDG